MQDSGGSRGTAMWGDGPWAVLLVVVAGDSRGARVVAHLVLQQRSPRPRHEHA